MDALGSHHIGVTSTQNYRQGPPPFDFSKPTRDCVVMKEDTYGSIFRRQLQSFVQADGGYKWHTLEEIIAGISATMFLGISLPVLQGKMRNNEGKFLNQMINNRLIEIDSSCTKFRVHDTHHKNGYGFID